MGPLVAIFAAFCIASFSAFVTLGFQLRLPVWESLLFVGVALSISFGVAELAIWVQRRAPRVSFVAGSVVGAALVLGWRSGTPMALATVALGALLLVRCADQPRVALRLAVLTFVVVLWLSGVQYLNYVLLAFRADALVDPWLRASDLAAYGALWGAVDYAHLFPIVRDPWLFRLFENGYLSLVTQMFIVLVGTADRPDFSARFLTAGLSAHLIAMAVFIVVPAVGPTLYYPDALDPSFSGSVSGQAISAMRTDYLSIARGGQPVTGYGYFIALPSLHAAISVLCLLAVRRNAFLMGVLTLPCVLLLASTVLLGQHYIADLVAGTALGALLGMWVARDVAASLSASPPCERDTGSGAIEARRETRTSRNSQTDSAGGQYDRRE